ncbi:MAG: DNA topoisomerase I [Steroidobacteraceae bacterium]
MVESPAKAKTIKKYLGKDFEVLASYGHVRDLVPKEGAVDPNKHFAMRYQLIDKNEKHVQAISRAMKKAEALYLATDPDREGEAISWHILQVLKEQKALEDKEVHRVAFYEITRNAIQEAIAHPRDVSNDLVNAQQARRALDYLVGFNLSPLLWKKAGLPGASAGRVQSPALRLICEREEEILNFKPREYWTVDADVAKQKQNFTARLIEYRGTKVEQFTVTQAEQAAQVKQTIESAAGGKLKVTNIDKKQRKRNPSPPFTTSTLQQEASRKLGFGAQRTMRLAQQLYEGVDFGEGAVGLITYMRTDSVNLAAEAIADIRQTVTQLYGAKALPEEARAYKTKAKNAQEAHEAVRPTSAAVTPERLAGKIEPDLLKLYSLIWKRTVACQMAPAVYDTVAVDMIPANEKAAVLRANGSTLVEPGYLAVYIEGTDDVKEDEDDRILPAMNAGDVLDLLNIRTAQHFTEPPPRYSEASLVKALEEFGIGRPSTYASIIQTLLGKKYAELENRRFTPTDLGKIINKFLTRNFEHYVNYGFTAKMEDDLDEIADGNAEWVQVLTRFWTDFKSQVSTVDETITRDDVSESRELGADPVTGKPISVRYGRFGPFVQLGTKDDADKPKFASLKATQRMDNITLADALELFKMPRTLGNTPAGEVVKVAIGRFGPYVQYGAKNYVSIKTDDPYSIELPRALELIQEKLEFEKNRLILDFPEDGIQVLNGRYGPYITDKVKNAKIPKGREPNTLTREEVRELIAAAPVRPKRGAFGRPAAKTAAKEAPAESVKATAKAPAKAPAKTAAKKTASAKTAKRKV